MEALEKLIGEYGKITSRNDTAIGHQAGEVSKLTGKASAKPVQGRARSVDGWARVGPRYTPGAQ